MLNIYLFLLFAILGPCGAEESEPCFLEGCPYVQLTGKVESSTLPGAPNYESIENGDCPSERWFLIPSETSKRYLVSSGVFEKIPENYRPVLEDWKERVGSIQVSASGVLEKEFAKRRNQELVLEGWLGSWDTHCYSLFFFEADKIKN
jgi:hypothetical protein